MVKPSEEDKMILNMKSNIYNEEAQRGWGHSGGGDGEILQ